MTTRTKVLGLWLSLPLAGCSDHFIDTAGTPAFHADETLPITPAGTFDTGGVGDIDRVVLGPDLAVGSGGDDTAGMDTGLPQDTGTPQQEPASLVVCESASVLGTRIGRGATHGYQLTAVNNSPAAARDAAGNLHVVYSGGVSGILHGYQSTAGWQIESVPSADTTAEAISPAMRLVDGRLHAAWVEFHEGVDRSATMVYASRDLAGSDWSLESMAPVEDALKYPVLAVGSGVQGTHVFLGVTQGLPDVFARLYQPGSKEHAMSPLNTGLSPYWQTSSDLTLDAHGDEVVLVWEEDWAAPSLGEGERVNLFFRSSADGGRSWSQARPLLAQAASEDGLTRGGDASVCVSDTMVYVAYQQTMPGPHGVIRVARMPVGGDGFEPMFFDGADYLGYGWLPAIDCQDDRVVVAWEHSTVEYMAKGTHQVAAAWVLDADTDAHTTLFTERSSTDPMDDKRYDLSAGVWLSEDGLSADVLWAGVDELDGVVALTHRRDGLEVEGCGGG